MVAKYATAIGSLCFLTTMTRQERIGIQDIHKYIFFLNRNLLDLIKGSRRQSFKTYPSGGRREVGLHDFFLMHTENNRVV